MKIQFRGTSQTYTATYVGKDELGTNPRFYFHCPAFADARDPKGLTSMTRHQINRDCTPVG